MTRTELRAAIRALTMVEGLNVSDTTLNTYINQALQEISVFEKWRWLQETVNLTVVAATQTYSIATLAADFNHAIMLVDDDYDARVPYISPAQFFAAYGNDTGNTGTRAYYWTIFENNIYLHPIPSANDTARYTLYYYETTATLAADGDSPPFHAGFHWAIVEWVKWKLWEREEYFEQAQASRQAFYGMLESMRSWYANVTEQEPFLWGDSFRQRIFTDPNIPLLDG